REHPVAEGVAQLLASGRVEAAQLSALIDAREKDLDPDGIATLEEFLAYADATAGAFNRAALAVLGATDAVTARASDHVARAVAVAGQLRSVAANAVRGRVLLPRAFLGGHGVSAAAMIAGRPGPGLATAARELADLARNELAAARALRADVWPSALPVLVAARFAERHFARLEKARYDVFSENLEPPPVALPLALAAAMLTRRW
ncbi:MAG: hypothetical protein RL477_1483, partial [Pseudomonadota bacterium]